jgi:hypothetical protein
MPDSENAFLKRWKLTELIGLNNLFNIGFYKYHFNDVKTYFDKFKEQFWKNISAF